MTLRWYQDEAIESVFDYFESGNKGNPVIALPTGTGKSHVISGFQKRAIEQWPNQRFINLTHVKELVEQNAAKMRQEWPEAPIGINSAGLNKRDIDEQIIFAGIASIQRKPLSLGWRDIMIIDEAHLVSPNAETMYGRTICALQTINPHMKVLGLTATDFRVGQGRLADSDGIFTDVCYNMTDIDGFSRLLAEGYLSPLYPKRTIAKLDTSNVGSSGGEFKVGALQAAIDQPDVTQRALTELCQAGWDRNSWLVFAAGVDHAEHIAAILNSFGVLTAAIHSKITSKDRTDRLNAFKRGELRCLVNNNVLTTGFDFPPIDLIGMFRPTMSPGLWVQMLGRGTRPWPGGHIDVAGVQIYWPAKQNCLCMDFAGNTERLGPINDPLIPKAKGDKTGDAPIKICTAILAGTGVECGTFNHISARNCMCCGDAFEVHEQGHNISATASDMELMRSEAPETEMFNVTQVIYRKHTKKSNGVVSLRCDYYSGLQRFPEWVSFEGKGMAKHKAHEWWHQRHASEPPATVDEALSLVSQLRAPRRIRVWLNKKFPEIISHEY